MYVIKFAFSNYGKTMTKDIKRFFKFFVNDNWVDFCQITYFEKYKKIETHINFEK